MARGIAPVYEVLQGLACGRGKFDAVQAKNLSGTNLKHSLLVEYHTSLLYMWEKKVVAQNGSIKKC